MDRWPYRDMDVLAGIVHGHARERHPMLPANQSAYASSRRGHGWQVASITIAHHEPFRVGRHEFPMVVSELSILRNSEKRVIEVAISRTGIDSLTRSDHNRNFEISRRFAERIHFLAGNGDAVISELREDLFRGCVFPQCCARTHIQPRRVARQPGLSKRNEPRISLCRLLDEIESLCEARSFVQVNGSGLRDGHTHSLRLSSPLSCFLCHEGMLLRVAVYFAKPITEGSTLRPPTTPVGLGSKGCSSTPFVSAMVIARRLAASVGLSSKRPFAPSDWRPTCDHKEA